MRKIIAVLALFPALALAALSSLDTRTTATGNGVTTAFTYVFPVQRNADVAVYLGGVEQLGGYTLLRNADQEANPGGSVTFTTAPAAGMAVRIERATPLLQDSVWAPYSPFRAKSLESALDRNVMQMQEVERTLADYIAADTAIAAEATSITPILATGTTTPLTLADWTGMVLNVKAFGAVGDGVADDTAAVQACINAAGRGQIASQDWGVGEGGVCFLPRGVYKITDTVHWETDGTVLAGEGANASAVFVDLGNAAKDGITIGNAATGGGRRSGVRDLSVYNAATRLSRDAISIDGAAWWRLENLHIHQAGRHGLTIRGTLNGSAINVRSSYNGNSGVFVQSDSTGVGHTTTDFYHLYTQNNDSHGVLLEKAHIINFFGPIIEFNGIVSGAANGDGIRLGTTVDALMEINLHGAYFESNKGWDINAGVAAAGSNFHLVNVYGFFGEASTAPGKATGYGFFYGTRAQGAFVGGRLSGYTAGLSRKTYSLDSLCKVTILGPQGDINDTNAPEYRSGTSINEYTGGLVQWINNTGETSIYGRYNSRVGGPGASASIAVRRASVTPADGTCAVGDHAFNTSTSYGSATGWRCTVAGSPGTWIPTGFVPSISGTQGDTSPTLTHPIEPIVRFSTTLTANRTVTLSPTGASRGQVVKIVRTGLGAFTLNVGPGLKTIPASTRATVEVAFDGSAWVLTGYSLLDPEPLRATTTVNLGPIGTDACTNTTVTVTGAVTGAECVAGLPAGLPDQLFATCHVESADTVHAHVCNLGTSYDPPNATYSVRVLNP